MAKREPEVFLGLLELGGRVVLLGHVLTGAKHACYVAGRVPQELVAPLDKTTFAVASMEPPDLQRRNALVALKGVPEASERRIALPGRDKELKEIPAENLVLGISKGLQPFPVDQRDIALLVQGHDYHADEIKVGLGPVPLEAQCGFDFLVVRDVEHRARYAPRVRAADRTDSCCCLHVANRTVRTADAIGHLQKSALLDRCRDGLRHIVPVSGMNQLIHQQVQRWHARCRVAARNAEYLVREIAVVIGRVDRLKAAKVSEGLGHPQIGLASCESGGGGVSPGDIPEHGDKAVRTGTAGPADGQFDRKRRTILSRRLALTGPVREVALEPLEDVGKRAFVNVVRKAG